MRVRGAAATCTKQEDAAVTSCLCYCQPATEGLNQIYTGTQGPPRKTLAGKGHESERSSSNMH